MVQTRRLFLSPSSVWSLLCICHRSALPSCWTWRSFRWCSLCLHHRCTPCAGCIWHASQSWQSQKKTKPKTKHEGLHEPVRPLSMAYPITIIVCKQYFWGHVLKFGRVSGDGKPNTHIHAPRKILSICELLLLIHHVFKALLCVIPGS